jgi:CDP-glucose 4,6-dehydratase
LESLVNLRQAFAGKKVWISGHTGFKGSWLTTWLLELGAEVAGYALPAEGPLFRQLGLARHIRHEQADIRNLGKLRKSLSSFRPDFVFHLAAQPLVRRSYGQPCETFEVNTLGTAYVLDALKVQKTPCAAVFVTTDKVYENRETRRRYLEKDPLGGRDPYSASKAAAEIIIASYRSSFFQKHPVRVVSARAGNVIGGGDWAEDRILPDCVRALQKGKMILVRNPRATRPWQHVLEPLGGYLALAARLSRGGKVSGSYNFGPAARGDRTVEDLVKEILIHWPGKWKKVCEAGALHEAGLLHLNNRLAEKELGWRPCWGFRQTIRQTIQWYRRVERRETTPWKMTLEQINAYEAEAHLGERKS